MSFVRVFVCLVVLVNVAVAFRARRSIQDRPASPRLPTSSTPDYFESKVNEAAGLSCEVCLKAIYGLNYNAIRLKKAVLDMIRLDCEALFHGQAEDIAQCIRLMAEKVEKYYNKVEHVIDTRNVCVQLRMCAPTSAPAQ